MELGKFLDTILGRVDGTLESDNGIQDVSTEGGRPSLCTLLVSTRRDVLKERVIWCLLTDN